MHSALAGVALGLFSAVALAFANLAVKLGSDIMVSRSILSISAAVMLLPFTLLVPAPDAATFHVLLFAIPAHFLYQCFLIQALGRGDLSLVFPVMRGASPLITAVVAGIALHEPLAPIEWVGLAIATGAVIVFALPPGGMRLSAHPDKRALGWALATAGGVALYNTTDSWGVRTAPAPVTYIVWLFLFDWIGVTMSAIVLRRGALLTVFRQKWRYGAAAGALSILSFGAALYAFSFVETAKVSALRETAVVWAAIMGALWLKEGFGARRIVAALVLAAGLVLLQFGG
ncbi:EamA family transporter [Stakelama sediminis]|uniref:Drug/metabolite transporter (DMT)-like permease n=1 Tax=Stakelama sediminis TaxID=463200 RepID=A0A840Z0Y8_9SPHN|nr:DMT family transporter [Stakelama sediminis]MBB5719585.1 drug/metabolite transporter (DMT)-like permease [Stakelama sediminis]